MAGGEGTGAVLSVDPAELGVPVSYSEGAAELMGKAQTPGAGN